jgi:antitoxin YefM
MMLYGIMYNKSGDRYMAEQLKSITDARKSLREISQTAQDGMHRYIITNQGQPQSVLLGYKEYQGLKATVELLNRPEELARLRTGLGQLSRGERLSFDEMRHNLQRRRAQPKENAASAGEIVEKEKRRGRWTQYADKGEAPVIEPAIHQHNDPSQGLRADISPARAKTLSKLLERKVRLAPVQRKAHA